MPSTNIMQFIWSILTPEQHALVSSFSLTGGATNSATKAATKTKRGRPAIRTQRTTGKTKMATRGKVIPALFAWYQSNPGAHTLEQLAKGTGLRSNNIQKALNTNLFRKVGDGWVVNRMNVDRTLTQKAA